MTNEEHFQAGEYIVKQGSVGDRFSDPRWQCEDRAEQGDRQGEVEIELANLRPGHGFGEMALMTDERRGISHRHRHHHMPLPESFNQAIKSEGEVSSFAAIAGEEGCEREERVA